MSYKMFLVLYLTVQAVLSAKYCFSVVTYISYIKEINKNKSWFKNSHYYFWDKIPNFCLALFFNVFGTTQIKNCY